MIWVVALILPFVLTGIFLNATRGMVRIAGVVGIFVFPLIVFAYFWQSTAVVSPEGDDDWNAVWAIVQLTYLLALWFVSALVGCLVGWLTLRRHSRRRYRGL
jgi:cell division protein FtsX